MIFELPDLLGLLRGQERLFFSGSAGYSNWGVAAMSETEGQGHGEGVGSKIGINGVAVSVGY